MLFLTLSNHSYLAGAVNRLLSRLNREEKTGKLVLWSNMVLILYLSSERLDYNNLAVVRK